MLAIMYKFGVAVDSATYLFLVVFTPLGRVKLNPLSGAMELNHVLQPGRSVCYRNTYSAYKVPSSNNFCSSKTPVKGRRHLLPFL